ncbi:adenylyl-sulfate kinase [Burkholderia cenocepacia]|uniref:adenylyl-sulfate kinase n=1 Tax=Burkholderia cenocepacia TaxID=95486 RepID=UPI000F5BA061|nr:adenylyl-sulfate kinase [Burkholderia cenocepacia]MCA7922219.1 adenylyl-sulfate kinase [Burkholderia cenocepacia]RQV07313.1 adenylyl-sulfate kinase [Burkholderia cenocepacia]
MNARASGRLDARHGGAVVPGQRAVTVWLTGLSGAGKSTLSMHLRAALSARGVVAATLDGDVLRGGASRDLGFTPSDRTENVRRAAEFARLLNDQGLVVIAALITPYRRERALARAIVGASRFVEVFVSTPLAVCEARDPKGLYRLARAGGLDGLTGVGSPYERPTSPAMVVDTGGRTPAQCTDDLLRHLAPMIVRAPRPVR